MTCEAPLEGGWSGERILAAPRPHVIHHARPSRAVVTARVAGLAEAAKAGAGAALGAGQAGAARGDAGGLVREVEDDLGPPVPVEGEGHGDDAAEDHRLLDRLADPGGDGGLAHRGA